MNFKEWLGSLFGRAPDDSAERIDLDAQQRLIAGRLAKMEGSTRDEVLAEAYRRARLSKEAQSYRPR